MEVADQVKLFLLAAESRIGPLKCAIIPRMELLTALICARLCKLVIDAIGWKDMKRYFWSDSTTVLTRITKEDNWLVFVMNCIQEIRNLSDPFLMEIYSH